MIVLIKFYIGSLLNLQNESLCLLDSGFSSTDVPGPYILIDDDENVLIPGATCMVTLCFTSGFFWYFRTPTKSCVTGI